jgi:hypothetical protein
MEIAKQNDLIDKISEQYRPYILALRTTDLKSTHKTDNIKAITLAVVKATSLTGKINMDTNVDVFISTNFYEQIIVKYPYARHGEISLAFQKGALGEYGEYFGVNVTTCWKWWKAYIESKELIAAKKEWINLIEMPKHDPDVKPLNLNEAMREPILNAFEDYKVNGKLPFTASSFYSIICQLKGVKTLIGNVETRKRIKETAYRNYEESLVKKGLKYRNINEFNLLLETCLKGTNPSYDTESRKLALKEYFNECITKQIKPI